MEFRHNLRGTYYMIRDLDENLLKLGITEKTGISISKSTYQLQLFRLEWLEHLHLSFRTNSNALQNQSHRFHLLFLEFVERKIILTKHDILFRSRNCISTFSVVKSQKNRCLILQIWERSTRDGYEPSEPSGERAKTPLGSNSPCSRCSSRSRSYIITVAYIQNIKIVAWKRSAVRYSNYITE